MCFCVCGNLPTSSQKVLKIFLSDHVLLYFITVFMYFVHPALRKRYGTCFWWIWRSHSFPSPSITTLLFTGVFDWNTKNTGIALFFIVHFKWWKIVHMLPRLKVGNSFIYASTSCLRNPGYMWRKPTCISVIVLASLLSFAASGPVRVMRCDKATVFSFLNTPCAHAKRAIATSQSSCLGADINVNVTSNTQPETPRRLYIHSSSGSWMTSNIL